MIVTTTARHLQEGDVLVGSGFIVTHNAWAGVRTPKGKVNVAGHYPGGADSVRHWGASTSVQVMRES